MSFAATPGEGNRVTLAADATGVTVTDAGARLRAGRRCRAVSRHIARCRLEPRVERAADVHLADRGDVLRASGRLPIAAEGGTGDDNLRGSGGADRLDGLSDDDVLTGGGGDDALYDGAGRDVLRAGRGHDDLHPGGDGIRDVLRGGPGEDELDFLFRPQPAVVDLSGRGGEDDTGGIEEIYAPDAADTLTGDGGANLLNGGGGADRIRAGGGDDLVHARDPGADVGCGSGTDTVVVQAGPLLRPDCEIVSFTVGRDRRAQPRSVSADAVTFAFACPKHGLTLTARDGATLADGPAPAGADGCRVTLTNAGRVLPRPAPVVVDGLHERWAFLLAT